MGHDPTKILLGTTGSSDRPGSTVYASDPLTYKAGLAVRLSTAGLLTLTGTTWAGISLGRSLSDHKKTTVLRAGSRVPLLLTDDSAGYAYAVVGGKVDIDDATGMGVAAGSGTTTSDAVFVSGALDAVLEDGTVAGKAAYIDMIGGL